MTRDTGSILVPVISLIYIGSFILLGYLPFPFKEATRLLRSSGKETVPNCFKRVVTLNSPRKLQLPNISIRMRRK